MLIGIEANRARARHVLARGRGGLLRALLGASAARPRQRRGGQRAAGRDDALLARLARRGRGSPTTTAAADPALGADDQGADLHADRGDGRGADDVAAGDARRGAQLGLPLHLDPRLDVHASGAALPRTSTGRPTSSCSSSPTSSATTTAALQIMYGIDGRRDLTETLREELSGYAGARPVRIGNGAFDQRQNDVFGAALDSVLLHTRRSQRLPRRLWPLVQSQAECADRGVAQARPGDLGGARQAAAVRVLEADVLGRDGPRRQARRHPRRRRPRRELGRDRRRRSRPTSSSTGSTSAGCCASTTPPSRSTRRRCWPRSSASCPATTSGCARACWRSPTS